MKKLKNAEEYINNKDHQSSHHAEKFPGSISIHLSWTQRRKKGLMCSALRLLTAGQTAVLKEAGGAPWDINPSFSGDCVFEEEKPYHQGILRVPLPCHPWTLSRVFVYGEMLIPVEFEDTSE